MHYQFCDGGPGFYGYVDEGMVPVWRCYKKLAADNEVHALTEAEDRGLVFVGWMSWPPDYTINKVHLNV